MIRADLVTGFLGSGKTTFIKKYAAYFLAEGERVSVLENDYGAVNVDRLLLSELERDGCNIETIAGACDRDCHYRRFKTKLIALAMTGCDRVIIEPSGIFDTEEFFDVLREEPLDRFYEPGAVITVVDAALPKELSEGARYLLACQCAAAGRVVLSRTQLCTPEQTESTVRRLSEVLAEFGSKRVLLPQEITALPFGELTGEDMQSISHSGCRTDSIPKRFGEEKGFGTLYFMNTGLTEASAREGIRALLGSEDGQGVLRVKGFVRRNEGWSEINATRDTVNIAPCADGQDVIIVIGEQLQKERIQPYFRAPERRGE